MKRQKSLLAIALVIVVFMLAVLTACGNNADDKSGASTSDTLSNTDKAEEITEPAETGRAAEKDALPADINLDGETVHFFHRASFAEYLDGKADEGDILADAFYKRNLVVSERLNVALDYFTSTDDSPGTVVNSVLAGDDAIDVVLHTEWKMVGEISSGAFINVQGQDYLDLTRDWWLPNVTKELNILEDQTILFTGEMLTENIGSMSAMYVNKDLYENSKGSINELYQLILDGKWTHDVFAQYVEEAYYDENGDEKVKLGDQFGFQGDYWSSIDNLTFSTDISFYKRNEEGLPVLNMNSDRMVQLVDTIYRLYYENKGVIFTSEDNLVPQFTDNKVLFMGYRLGTATVAQMREMQSDYGVIPYPKLDDSQNEYVSLIHNASPVIAIPTTCKRLDAVFATLEALSSESYKSVTPTYYDVVLKIKYSRDDVSSQMIDLIYDGARKDLIYDLGPEGSGIITRKLIEAGMNNFVSFYKANEQKYVTGLEKLIEQQKNLAQ